MARVLALAAAIAVLATLCLSLYRSPFFFEINIVSSISGTAQIYYDVGKGIREEDSSIVPVHQGSGHYRLRLPAGSYRNLRFDPTDKGGNEIVLSAPRITDRSGRTVRTFPGNFGAAQEIDRMVCEADVCRLKTSRSGTDPILSVNLDAPFTLSDNPQTFWKQVGQDFLEWLVGFIAAILLFGLFVRKTGPFLRRWSRATWNWATRQPRWAILAVSVISVVLSCYPVIFFGKSFVSPNILGSGMLYSVPPFLPGYQSTDLEDPKGADTAAMLWQNLPYSIIQSRSLRQDHELPLWNRYNSAGTPLLAQGLSMFGDPLHTIVLIASGAAWSWDLKFILAKVLFCCALGLMILRSAGHLPSALVLAASSAFIGFFVFRFDHPAFFSMCYAPWILLSWLEISRAHTPRLFAGWVCGLLLASWAELNSGGVKEGYMLLFSMHGCGLLVFGIAGLPGSRGKKLLHLVGIGIAFLLFSAPIWLLFWDTLKNSLTVYDVPQAFQIQPGLVLGFFDEIFYRLLNGPGNVFDPSANFLVLLGCLSAAAYVKPLLRERMFVAVTLGSLPVLALVFGVVPPAIITKIPVLANVAHVDNTFSCALIIQALVVAGFGLRCLDQSVRERSWNGDFLVISLGLLMLCGLYLGFTHAMQRAPDDFTPLGATTVPTLFSSLYGFSLIAALLALPVLGRILVRRASAAPFAVSLALLCLVLIHWRFGMHLKTEVSPIDDVVVNPQVRVNLQARSPALDWLEKSPSGFRTVGFGNTFSPGYDGIAGLESITGTDPLQNVYFRDLVITAKIPLIWLWRWVVEKEQLKSTLPLYNLLNVRYFLDSVDAPEPPHPSLFKVVDLDLKIYQNTEAWPRAFFVDKMVAYDSTAQFVALVMNSREGPFAAIQRHDLQDLPGIAANVASPGSPDSVQARNYKLTNNTTTFTIDAPRSGIAVLTEAYLPDDFIVRINGSTGSYFRVNHAFRGVIIPSAGTYTISFSYWPRRFTLSLLMAGFGALILVVWVVVMVRGERTWISKALPEG